MYSFILFYCTPMIFIEWSYDPFVSKTLCLITSSIGQAYVTHSKLNLKIWRNRLTGPVLKYSSLRTKQMKPQVESQCINMDGPIVTVSRAGEMELSLRKQQWKTEIPDCSFYKSTRNVHNLYCIWAEKKGTGVSNCVHWWEGKCKMDLEGWLGFEQGKVGFSKCRKAWQLVKLDK